MTDDVSNGASTAPARAPVDRAAFVRRALVVSGLLLAPICALAILADADLAIAIALGGLLGAVNLILLARGVGQLIDQTVAGIAAAKAREDSAASDTASAEGIDPAKVERPRGVAAFVRIGAIALAVVAVFLLRPARPLGLAIGFVVVLAGAAVAAIRQERAR